MHIYIHVRVIVGIYLGRCNYPKLPTQSNSEHLRRYNNNINIIVILIIYPHNRPHHNVHTYIGVCVYSYVCVLHVYVLYIQHTVTHNLLVAHD